MCEDLRVGLWQGCVMLPWLFKVYMDGVVRKGNVRCRVKACLLLMKT